MSKPTRAEAATLSKLFKGSQYSESGASTSFDPNKECVVIGEQSKKKAAIKSKLRVVRKSFLMLDRFNSKVPKGKARQKLISQGKCKTVNISRSMKAQDIKKQICRAFSVDKYILLECDGGHGLIKSSNQDNVDGEYLVQKKGYIYVCGDCEVIAYLLLRCALNRNLTVLCSTATLFYQDQ